MYEKGNLMEKIEKRTYTIPEAAKIIGISRSLAYQLAREGKLPTIKLSTKRTVIPIAALDRWLEESVNKPKT